LRQRRRAAPLVAAKQSTERKTVSESEPQTMETAARQGELLLKADEAIEVLEQKRREHTAMMELLKEMRHLLPTAATEDYEKTVESGKKVLADLDARLALARMMRQMFVGKDAPESTTKGKQ